MTRDQDAVRRAVEHAAGYSLYDCKVESYEDDATNDRIRIVLIGDLKIEDEAPSPDSAKALEEFSTGLELLVVIERGNVVRDEWINVQLS